MEGFCRSCLVKFDEPTDLMPYTEKNRRLFVYATGLQVKRNDTFTFQLCKECYLNMKVACNFKKTSRNSDKKFKNYLTHKESGDSVDFCTFLKNNDESLKFRLPMYAGNSTPANLYKDDDNESTCTSIQNFMTDILKVEEIPDSEARIIKEVIEEETDVLEDSLDSHWLQDDVSVDTDFRLDFSFSPFSTPRSTANDDHCYTPKRLNNPTEIKEQNTAMKQETDKQNYTIEDFNTYMPGDYATTTSNKTKDGNAKGSDKCIIDVNLENALKKDSAKKVMLDELLATPPVMSNLSAPPTPLIKNILFGDNMEIDTEARPKNVYMPTLTKDEIDDMNTNRVLDFESIKTDDQNITAGKKCVIDVNLENALKNDCANKVMLDKLLATPPVIPNISAPSTPLIKNIIFGDKIDIDTENRPKNVYVSLDADVENDVLNEFLDNENKIKEEYVEDYDEFYLKEDFNGKNHKQSCKRTDSKMSEIIKEPSSPVENKYCLKKLLCKICNRKFNLAKSLKVHCNRIHKIKIEAAKSKNVSRKMVCDYCGKVFTSSRCIVRHIQNHMNPDQYFCDRCPLAFRTKTGMKTHQSTHGIIHKGNEKTRKYVCNICGSVQSNSSNHNVHMRRHAKKYIMSCAICGKGFHRTYDLDTHMRCHTGERPFECIYCPSKFARQDSLNRHIKGHTGERPFLCTFCDDTFISAPHLKQHQTKCKTCLDKQMSILLETSEINNVNSVTVFYTNVTNDDDVASNG